MHEGKHLRVDLHASGWHRPKRAHLSRHRRALEAAYVADEVAQGAKAVMFQARAAVVGRDEMAERATRPAQIALDTGFYTPDVVRKTRAAPPDAEHLVIRVSQSGTVLKKLNTGASPL